MMDLTMWKLDPKLVKNAILGTGAFFDWYAAHEDPEVLACTRPGPMCLTFRWAASPGRRSTASTVPAAIMGCHGPQSLGVEVLTEHQAPAELTNGRISAIVAESPEGESR